MTDVFSAVSSLYVFRPKFYIYLSFPHKVKVK